MFRAAFILGFLSSFLLNIASANAQASGELKATQEKKSEWKDGIDLDANEFKNETRLGVVLSSGNTGSFSLSGNNTTKYRIRRFENNIRAGAYYNRISSVTGAVAPGTVARYIFGTYRLDYYLVPKATLYAGGGGYTDEIKGIETAGQGFFGLTQYLIREEHFDLGMSFGYDYTFEDRVAPVADQGIHSATAGLIYRQDINEIVTLMEKLDMLEDMENRDDFRLQSQTDLKVKMNSHLALIVGFQLRFDNEPVPGFRKLDTLTDVSLSVSF